jgi:hypothetical protein
MFHIETEYTDTEPMYSINTGDEWMSGSSDDSEEWAFQEQGSQDFHMGS